MSILVIGVTLSLPLGLIIAQMNFETVTANLGSSPEATLFLENDGTLDSANDLARALRADSKVRDARVIDKTTALTEFAGASEIDLIIESLDENPLPHAVVLRFEPSAFDGEAGVAFKNELENLPGVAEATFDITWIKRLEAVSKLIERTALVFASIIGIGVVLITGNTIRTGIQNRHDEIEVAKLCGATDAYVSRPFSYSGALQGLAGALLACGIVGGADWFLSVPAATLAAAYDSDWQLTNISGVLFTETLVAGALMGWLGAQIAVRVYLRRLDFGRPE